MVAANLVRGSALTIDGKNVFGWSPGMKINKDNIEKYLTPKNLDNARDALIAYSQGKNLPVRFDRAGEWSAVKQKEMARLQRAGDIKGEERLTVRQLIQMERELEFLDNLVMTEIDPPSAPKQASEGEDEKKIIVEQQDDDREWYEGVVTDFFGWTGGEDESATEAGQNRGLGGGN